MEKVSGRIDSDKKASILMQIDDWKVELHLEEAPLCRTCVDNFWNLSVLQYREEFVEKIAPIFISSGYMRVLRNVWDVYFKTDFLDLKKEETESAYTILCSVNMIVVCLVDSSEVACRQAWDLNLPAIIFEHLSSVYMNPSTPALVSNTRWKQVSLHLLTIVHILVHSMDKIGKELRERMMSCMQTYRRTADSDVAIFAIMILAWLEDDTDRLELDENAVQFLVINLQSSLNCEHRSYRGYKTLEMLTVFNKLLTGPHTRAGFERAGIKLIYKQILTFSEEFFNPDEKLAFSKGAELLKIIHPQTSEKSGMPRVHSEEEIEEMTKKTLATFETTLKSLREGNSSPGQENTLTLAARISEIIEKSIITNPPYHCYASTSFYEILAYRNGEITFGGSGAEFYIVPEVGYVNDMDYLLSLDCHVAYCGKNTDFEDLCRDLKKLGETCDMQETLQLVRIDDSNDELPAGYVYLIHDSSAIYNWDKEAYEMEFYRNQIYWHNKIYEILYTMPLNQNLETSGPAVVKQRAAGILKEYKLNEKLSTDRVTCVRCLTWPPSARYWLDRQRKYDCPTEKTIIKIKKKGCDVVPVAHRDSKGDCFQWRLSSSRAEMQLVRSWLPVQQEVYHLLRFFAKRELMNETWKRENEIICNYHIKTLMLWACELKPAVWWSSNPLLVICYHLLQTLETWLDTKNCPNYFFYGSNLFGCKMNEANYATTLNNLRIHCDLDRLSRWFESNYLPRMYRNTAEQQKGKPDFQTIRRESPMSITDLGCLVYSVSNSYFDKIQIESYLENTSRMSFFCNILIKPAYLALIRNEHETSKSIRTLNMACVLSRMSLQLFNEEVIELPKVQFLDVLSALVVKFVPGVDEDKRFTGTTPFFSSSKWFLVRGEFLLRNVLEQGTIEYCLWHKTCQQLFESSLQVVDKHSPSVRRPSNLYLAALHHVMSDQEKVVAYCERAGVETGESGLKKTKMLDCCNLLFIAEVAHVCGFILLYNWVITKHANRSPLIKLEVSLDFMIAYLTFDIHPDAWDQFEFQWQSGVEVCLFTVHHHKSKRNIGMKQSTDSTETGCNKKRDCRDIGGIEFSPEDSLWMLLKKLSIQYLTEFHECELAIPFNIPRCGIVSQYKALHFYQMKDFEKTLRLCDAILDKEALNTDYLFAYALSPTLFGFQIFFDYDVTSVTGLMMLTKRHRDKTIDVSKMLIIQPYFMILYLKARCHQELKHPKAAILTCLTKMKERYWKHPLENMLMLTLLRAWR